MSLCVTVDNRVQGTGFFLHYLKILTFIRRKWPFQWCPYQSDWLNGAWNMHINAHKFDWNAFLAKSPRSRWVNEMFVVVCKLFNSVLCVALTIISRVRHGDHNINICYSLGVRFGFEFLSLKARVTEVISILCQQLSHQWCVTLFVNMGVIVFNNAF